MSNRSRVVTSLVGLVSLGKGDEVETYYGSDDALSTCSFALFAFPDAILCDSKERGN